MEESLSATPSQSADHALPVWRIGPAPRWFVPCLLVLAGFAAFSIDLVVAEVARAGKHPGVVRELLLNAEPFGHAIGVAFLLIAVALFDPLGTRRVPRLLAAAIGAGLVADVFKLLLARTRPQAVPSGGDVWSTFGEWLPLLSGSHSTHSFPSAHAAVATGFAVALSHYHPRGRWLFATLAVLCGIQRIETGAHFPSDVCFGAAVGWIFAVYCLYAGGPQRFFERFEAPPRD